MITQFSVKNYKCIKDLAVLDMQALNVSEHDDSLLKDCNNCAILPVAVIYGPNGSGKSTVLDALSFLTSKILYHFLATSGKPQFFINEVCIPFKFDKNSNKMPSEFNIVFSTLKGEYDYEMKILGKNILYEKLNMTAKKKERITTNTLFVRNENEVKCENEFKGIKIDNKISSDISVLSFIKMLYGNNEVIIDIIEAFLKILSVTYSNAFSENNNQLLAFNRYREIDDNTKKMYIEMLNAMDIDIKGFRIEELNDPMKYRLYTSHSVDNEKYELNVNEESTGTQKILTLIPFIHNVLYDGGTLIVDELDAKIHPMLLKYIINLFTNKTINKHQAQLIFTSHDMTTMDKDVFRRDEIWFTAQNDEQATSLYSLVEFKDDNGKPVRKDASFNKQYLDGKYGADPYFRKIINWEKH